MLPRKGFFKNIQCPYNKANLCHRPYCHFRHAPSEIFEEQKINVQSTYLYDSPSSNVTEHQSSPYTVVEDSNGSGYVPTPVSNSKPAGILKTKNLPVSVPEYKPTPISKLKELNVTHGSYEDEPYSTTYVSSVRKKKNIEEYDPTEMRSKYTKKSVKFADEPVFESAKFSSDEDVLDDSTCTAKFSDDDDDDFEEKAPSPLSSLDTNQSESSISTKSSIDTPKEKEEEESDLDEKKVDEFSLVDKILTETKRNEKLLTFRKKESTVTPPVPVAPKVPLILKGVKVDKTTKNKSVTNSDIYNTGDDSQGSIPDYSDFGTLLPPIEIDSFIKSKYDKKNFNDETGNDSPKCTSDEHDTNPNEDTISNDESSKSSKSSKENFKSEKRSDEKKKSKTIVKSNSEKKLLKETDKTRTSSKKDDKFIKNKKIEASKKDDQIDKNKKSETSKRDYPTDKNKKIETSKKDDLNNKSKKNETSKKDDQSNKFESSKKTEKLKDLNSKIHKKSLENISSNKTDGKIKNSSSKVNTKSKDCVKQVSEKKEVDATDTSKLKHKNKSNFNKESSLKQKSSIKENSKVVHKKDSHKYSASSSSDAELQDGKVSSSSIVKKSKSSDNTKHSSFLDSKSKYSNVDSNRLKKPFKRKKDGSDSESSSGKSNSKAKSTFKIPKLSRAATSSADDSIDEIELSSDEEQSSKKRPREDCVSTTDEDSDISVIKTLRVKKSPSKKQRNSSVSSMDEDIAISSDSDNDPDAECWRIYNETFHEGSDENMTADKQDSTKEGSSSSQELNILRKKRVAHEAAVNLKKPKGLTEQKFKPYVNPGQVMHNRYVQMMKARDQGSETKTLTSQPLNSAGRTGIRIAVSPNNSLLAAIQEKKKLTESAVPDFSPLPSTVSKTLKTIKRVAHVPDMVSKPRPIIPADFGSKVPTNIRQKFLNAFIDEYLKFASSEEYAYEEALEEEKKAYQRSSSKAIYMNVSSNTLNRLRHKASEQTESKKGDVVSSTTTKKSVSHQDVLYGPMAHRTSFSINKKKPPPVPDLKGTALYEYLLTYAMSTEQLKDNGFPQPHPTEPGRVVVEGMYANKSKYCNDQFKRTCSRCQKVYYVNVDGEYVRDEECDYHWGRLWKRKIAGAFESRYNCCQGDSESDGCCVGTGHVFEGSETNAFTGFVRTLPKTPPPDKYYGIYALDCEMCYTTAGMELTRVTVVGPDLKPVYETFVKPQSKVLDYNTRFSGITEENLKSVRTSLRDVQAVLLCIFNDKTILIGHSLESDFKALKLIHTTVVDTSVVFPHKMGLPYKRALRTLMGENLNKIIQNDVGGHDSQEDAVACMELMLWKMKEDIKANR